MFYTLFSELRRVGVPVSLKEYLLLLEAMSKNLAGYHLTDFYYLARSALVKDERHLDKFDQVFSHVFRGLEYIDEIMTAELPDEWLKALTEKFLTEEEKAEIESLGGWDKIMEELQKRLEEQEKRHEGGSKAIGTGGTSPFGNSGYNPEGVRIGQQEGRHGKAVKVWDKREYKNLDDTVELGTRNIKVALRRLRRFAREGAPTELALDDTIRATAHQGYLDLIFRPERHNTVKVLLFFDVGGSMDPHIRLCEELFSAARTEFKHMEYFYFHNCPYEFVWKNNRRRHSERTDMWEVLHTYPADYKVIFVGDATMSPYEITYPGGSVEHWNEEPGAVWMDRITSIYDRAVWLNPTPERYWDSTPSIQIAKQLMNDRMFGLTLDGLDGAMKELSK